MLLVTDAVWQVVKDDYPARPSTPSTVRGREEPVAIYASIAPVRWDSASVRWDSASMRSDSASMRSDSVERAPLARLLPTAAPADHNRIEEDPCTTCS